MINLNCLHKILTFTFLIQICLSSSIDLTTDLYFVNTSDYFLIVPRVVNVNKQMNVYALCNFDDCRITFLFQCLKFVSENETKRLINVYDLVVQKKELIQNQSEFISFELPNLERCLEDLNHLAIETQIQSMNNLNIVNVFKHKFDLILSSYSFVKIITNLPAYKNGQLLKFLILPFNLNFKPFTQTVSIKLLLPNKLMIKEWTLNYFASDKLNQFEFKLSDKPQLGLWTIEVSALNQVFKKRFFVLNFKENELELTVNFKDHLLINQDAFKGSILIRNLPENSSNYYMKCSILILFKDFISKQEIQSQLAKFTIKQLTIENILDLDLNYLLSAIDRSRLNEFLNAKYDLRKAVYLRVQADIYCRNEDEDCVLSDSKQTAAQNIKLIEVSKYVFCPKQLQSNHSSPEFTIQIKCLLIKLLDDDFDDNSQESTSNESKEISGKTINEFITIQSYIRTYANYKIPFKTIRLRVTSNLILFDLNLAEKLDEKDLKNVLSLELELRLDNNFIERLIIHFKHQHLFKNLDILNKDVTNADRYQFKLKINRFEVRINESVTIYIESTIRVKNFYLILVTSGQLLDVQSIDFKIKSIRIKENMFPYLTLIAYTQLNGKSIFSKISIKINKKLPSSFSKYPQILTSFKKIENSSKLRIKLFSISSSFIHLRSIKKHLDQLDENLDLITYLEDLNANRHSTSFDTYPNLDSFVSKKDAHFDEFNLVSSCYLIQEAFDKCINHFKFSEPETNQATSLTSAVDNLFLNQTKKPFYFDILLYGQYAY